MPHAPRRPLSRTLLVVLVAVAALAPALAGSEEAATVAPRSKLADEQRLPWSRGDVWFLKTWLVAGPFPGTLADDMLVEHGGEAAIRPTVDLAHALPNGGSVVWRSFSAWSDTVGLDEAIGAWPDATGV